MTKKINISKEILNELYTDQNLSTHKIARRFNCDPSVIQKRLKEHSIKLRSPKEKINIPKKRLFDLYINKRFSTQKIAKIIGTSSCWVYYKLKENNIKIRSKNLLKIDRTELKKLYVDKGLSCSKIAEKLGYNKITVFNKLKKYKIQTRNPSLANTKYLKKKFDGSDELKAYMIGFRLGDLNVKAKNENWTIIVKSNTTKKEQFQLIKMVYGKYGHFKCNFNGKFYNTYCNLDNSFNFLLKKEDKIEDWIFKSDKLFFSFLGGYSDAEGNFGVYSGMARFRVGSYDKNILKQIADKLNLSEVKANFNLEGRAGIRNQNKDFYRVSVIRKESLLKLIQLLKPYIKHAKRYKDMVKCERNILERNKKREIKDL